MKKKSKNKNKPNCYNCKFYYVTWDEDFPYGCKALGFKTRKIPTEVVFESSGMRCLAFSKKNDEE